MPANEKCPKLCASPDFGFAELKDRMFRGAASSGNPLPPLIRSESFASPIQQQPATRRKTHV
jgi:hypothetical protein